MHSSTRTHTTPLHPPPPPPQSALNEGGKLLWIAPSGGRDRSFDPETGGWVRVGVVEVF
jgi:hypothetical protein